MIFSKHLFPQNRFPGRTHRLLLLVAAVGCVALGGFTDRVPARAGGKDYYVSNTDGNDRNGGTSPGDAWKTFGPVNARTFGPGDRILLKRNDIWSGETGLKPLGSGSPGRPIAVSAYGKGNKPVISIISGAANALELNGQSYWQIENLEVQSVNHNGVAVNGRPGTKVEHIRIVGVDARNCSPGFGQRAFDHCGIRVGLHGNGGNPPGSWFEDVRVEGCNVDNCATGIMIAGNKFDETRGVNATDPVTKNVHISNSKAANLRGDGIVIFSAANCSIQKSVCANACTFNGDPEKKYTAGIWTWNVRNALVRECESYGHTTPGGDRQPFDIDYLSYNTTFEYNYGHDCYGSAILLCAPKGTNDLATFRYSVFKNCGYGREQNGFIHFYDCETNQRRYIYNNTFVGAPATFVSSKKDSAFVYLYNNLFLHTEGVTYQALLRPGYHDHNLVYNVQGYPQEPHGIRADPLLSDTGRTGTGYADGLQLRPGSPAVDGGADLTKLPIGVSDMGRRDYWGNAIPQGKGYDIGAHERK